MLSVLYFCKAGGGISVDDKIFQDFRNCLLNNYDPTSGTIIYPDIFENFTSTFKRLVHAGTTRERYVKLDPPEMINSHNLPKIKLTIKANRMQAPKLVQ